MVLYDYDSNAVITEAMKKRSDPEMIRAYDQVISTLASKGLKPQLQRLDNEASSALQKYLTKQDIDYQLSPPHIHRRNAAERAIRTFKNHFIAGLCSTDKLFPLHLWDKLLEQATITINLLRQSRINPKLSAYAQLYGAFDFNRTPLAPPGTRVIAHEKPKQRGTWAPHGVDGWYIGPAMNHYRCYRIQITKTNSERICDTVEFFPTHVTMPRLSSTDAATHAAISLIHALQHPSPAGPFSIDSPTMDALKQLAIIFKNATPNPDASPRVGVPLHKPAVTQLTEATKTTTEIPMHQPFFSHKYPTRQSFRTANAVIN